MVMEARITTFKVLRDFGRCLNTHFSAISGDGGSACE